MIRLCKAQDDPEADGYKGVIFNGKRPTATFDYPVSMGYALFKNGKFPELILHGLRSYVERWIPFEDMTYIYTWDSIPLNLN